MSYSCFCENIKCQYHYEVHNGIDGILTRERSINGYETRTIKNNLLIGKNGRSSRLCDVCKEAIDMYLDMEKDFLVYEPKKGSKNVKRTTKTRNSIKPKTKDIKRGIRKA